MKILAAGHGFDAPEILAAITITNSESAEAAVDYLAQRTSAILSNALSASNLLDVFHPVCHSQSLRLERQLAAAEKRKHRQVSQAHTADSEGPRAHIQKDSEGTHQTSSADAHTSKKKSEAMTHIKTIQNLLFARC